MAQVIVVGGGLSGLSAAHTVLERGGKVLVLEKNPFLGGNSTKATSGINGALTKTQIKLNIPDSPEKFYDDTAHSARDLIRPDLVKVLTYNSASAVEWLQEKFKLDLSLVSRLGGHSFPRTHRGKEKFPGMTITYALMEKLEDLAKTDAHRVRIHKRARVTRLLTDNNGGVIGVEYEHDGKLQTEHGVIVLATGGYAADFAEDGLLKQIRPDLIHLPTTNGDWSTGDGIKMTKAIGGNTVDLEKVQVHPTGLVDPNEPDAKVKFLAAEALRGCGGILLDKNGKRFADELGHRDYVTGQMWKNQGPFRLVLNGAAAREIEWHCKHYMGRGLMKFYKHGKDIAAEMGISVDVLKKTFDDYNGFAQNKNDPFGKKYFHNLPFTVDDEFYVAIVTPVLHYTMGGLEINADSAILRGSNKQPIPGLFAAGELCGGVHGANRLGGSSLLGCVVYGRVSGDSASRYLFGKLSEGSVASATKRVGALGSQLTGNAPLTATITVEPGSNRVGLEITWDGQGTTAPNAPAPAPVQAVTAAPQPAKPTRDANKEYSWEEVAKHNKESDCWVVVNGQVLDVTSFLKDHPGGKKAILLYAGRDASEEFNMLHKPDVVEKYAPESIIGKISGPAPKGGHAPAKGGSASGGKQASAVARKEVTLSPSNVESKTSGGTADILPQVRPKL